MGVVGPGILQSLDLFMNEIQRNPGALSQSSHSGNGSVEIAKISRPFCRSRKCKFEKLLPGFLAEGHALSGLARVLVQFELKIRFDVFGTVAQAGHPECPEIDAAEQIFPEQ